MSEPITQEIESLLNPPEEEIKRRIEQHLRIEPTELYEYHQNMEDGLKW